MIRSESAVAKLLAYIDTSVFAADARHFYVVFHLCSFVFNFEVFTQRLIDTTQQQQQKIGYLELEIANKSSFLFYSIHQRATFVLLLARNTAQTMKWYRNEHVLSFALSGTSSCLLLSTAPVDNLSVEMESNNKNSRFTDRLVVYIFCFIGSPKS